jgi:hypothetical protein
MDLLEYQGSSLRNRDYGTQVSEIANEILATRV